MQTEAAAVAPVTLLDLPDHALVLACEHLIDDAPLRLATVRSRAPNTNSPAKRVLTACRIASQLCVAGSVLNRTLSSPDAEPLWASLCVRHRARASADCTTAKTRFGRVRSPTLRPLGRQT
jgi:hypothetical protein